MAHFCRRLLVHEHAYVTDEGPFLKYIKTIYADGIDSC